MFKWLLIVLLVIIAGLLGSLIWIIGRTTPLPPPTVISAPAEMSETPNVTVHVHQSAINDMLAAMFPYEGKGELMHKPISIPYSWKVEKPHVELTVDGPVMSAEARVHIMGASHTVSAQGRAEVRYDSTEQTLYLDLHEIRTHTDAKILGIPLDKLNLAPPALSVGVLGHLPLLANFIVKKPNVVREGVRFSIVGHRIQYEKGQVRVDFAVRFKEMSEGVGASTQKTQGK